MVTSEKQGNIPTILSNNPYVLEEQLEFTHLTEISKTYCCKSDLHDDPYLPSLTCLLTYVATFPLSHSW